MKIRNMRLNKVGIKVAGCIDKAAEKDSRGRGYIQRLTCTTWMAKRCLGLILALGLGGNAFAQSSSTPKPAKDPVSTSLSFTDEVVNAKEVVEVIEEEYSHQLDFFWESRYVSEGRDNLLGGGLVSITTKIELGPIVFAPWYAYGYDTDYDELDLCLVYGYQFNDDIEFELGYCHLRYFEDNFYENEFGAGVVLKHLKVVDFYANVIYLVESDGSFFETGITHEFELTDRLSLNAIANAGFNAGYMADGHDGANNVQLMLEVGYKLCPKWELTAYAGYNWAIDSDPGRFGDDEFLYDFFWGGVGVTMHF